MSTIKVEVVYALPDEQKVFALEVEQGAMVEDVIKQSGILEVYADIDLQQNKVGIYSELVDINTVLRNHDRVEIYRSLEIDPKAARKLRAERAEDKKS
jgi:putative ubiquitin-RnfH superfamily antitoxin RatB of RatAB toxin-antitoxin module